MQCIEFYKEDKLLWTCRIPTTGPQSVIYNPDKKLEDTRREANNPTPDFIRFTPLSNYATKKGRGILASLEASLVFNGVIVH